jgi:hypothetical protein
MCFSPKIHAWGGLGSQLFAIALAFDLSERFFRKKPTLVLHTSGVTKRHSEMELFKQDFHILEIDDFKAGAVSQSNPSFSNGIIRNLTKKFLSWIRVLGQANSSLESRRVKPWTFIYRGHYSYRYISHETTIKIARRLGIVANATEKIMLGSGKQIVVHYRLGDLVTLSSKGPVSLESLSLQIKKVCDSLDTNSFFVYSDDLPLATELLSKSLPDYRAIPCSGTTVETLKSIAESLYFIGTNSKISIWGAILRHYLNSSMNTCLPYSFHNQIERNIRSLSTVKFYG